MSMADQFGPGSVGAQEYDRAAVTRRSTAFAAEFLKAALTGGSMEDEAAERKFAEGFKDLLADSLASLKEVTRLYARFEELKRRHLPFAGEPGAPALCTACSLHGGQLAWPCEVYRFADASVPKER